METIVRWTSAEVDGSARFRSPCRNQLSCRFATAEMMRSAAASRSAIVHTTFDLGRLPTFVDITLNELDETFTSPHLPERNQTDHQPGVRAHDGAGVGPRRWFTKVSIKLPRPSGDCFGGHVAPRKFHRS